LSDYYQLGNKENIKGKLQGTPSLARYVFALGQQVYWLMKDIVFKKFQAE
jgi:hypothetical protein